MKLMSILLQIIILVLGISAVLIVGRPEDWKKWGFVVGLVSQIFWAILFIESKQYFMIIGVVFYSIVWLIGFVNNIKVKESK